MSKSFGFNTILDRKTTAKQNTYSQFSLWEEAQWHNNQIYIFNFFFFVAFYRQLETQTLLNAGFLKNVL